MKRKLNLENFGKIIIQKFWKIKKPGWIVYIFIAHSCDCTCTRWNADRKSSDWWLQSPNELCDCCCPCKQRLNPSEFKSLESKLRAIHRELCLSHGPSGINERHRRHNKTHYSNPCDCCYTNQSWDKLTFTAPAFNHLSLTCSMVT